MKQLTNKQIGIIARSIFKDLNDTFQEQKKQDIAAIVQATIDLMKRTPLYKSVQKALSIPGILQIRVSYYDMVEQFGGLGYIHNRNYGYSDIPSRTSGPEISSMETLERFVTDNITDARYKDKGPKVQKIEELLFMSSIEAGDLEDLIRKVKEQMSNDF